MKNVIWVVLLMGMVSSCSVFKKVNKTTEKTEVKTDETVTKTTVLTEKTTEVIDTTVKINGSAVENEKPISNILKGDSLISENGQVKGLVTYNEKTGRLTLKTEQKPQAITIKKTIEKTKIERMCSNVVTHTAVKTTAKNSSKKAFRLPWWLWLIPVVVVLVYYRKWILAKII